MKNTIKWVLSLLIFFAAAPTVQASDMNNSAGMEEIKKKKPDYIRVHDSGDYYSPKYLLKWFDIAKQNPHVKFYSYTNSVKIVKDAIHMAPDNYDFIFSDSGKQVRMINILRDRHTKIFKTHEELKQNNWGMNHH